MPVFETAAFERLAMAIATSVGRHWLEQTRAARRRAMPLLDVAVESSGSPRLGRRIERQFSQLADSIAERLASTLEHEYRDLPDEDWLAAVELATRVLQTQFLSDQRLFASDLSTPQLLRDLIAAEEDTIATARLSDNGRAAFELVLGEALAQLLTAIQALPEFQARVPAELLRRDTQIIEMLNAALEAIPRRVTDPTTIAGEAFTTDYRREVARRTALVTFFGLPAGIKYPRQNLATAYVALTVGRRRGRGSTADTGGQSIEHALLEQSRLLLMGEAGSGKTTLLQWLALQTAGQAFQPAYRDLNGLVPVLLTLRSLNRSTAGISLPAPDELTAQQAWMIHNEQPQGWVRRLLESGRAMVLLDGVDELVESDRTRFHEWLTELVDRFPSAKWVVTTRPEAVPEDWLRNAGFSVGHILPLADSQIAGVVTGWHDAAAELAETAEADSIRRYGKRLLTALETSTELRALASNPLLCVMMCVLHHHRHGTLPKNRMELYRTALEMMLNEREVQRNVAAPVGLELNLVQKITVLQYVAFWLLTNDHVEAPFATIAARVGEVLPRLGRDAHDADAVLRHLLVRSGLLRRVGAENVDFVHKTFLEYLAAKQAIETESTGQLIANALNDAWREVIVLAVGHARPAERDMIITAVLDYRTPSRDDRRTLNRLALDCLETADSLSPEVRRRVTDLVRTYFPPTSHREVARLVSYGPQVLQLLSPLPKALGAAGLTHCIQLAASIPGEQSLAILEDFARVYGHRAFNSLVSAWPQMPPVPYAERVLSIAAPDDAILRLTDARLATATRSVRGASAVRWALGPDGGDAAQLSAGLPIVSFSAIRQSKLRTLAALQGQPIQTLQLLELPSLMAVPFKSLGNLEKVQIAGCSSLDISELCTRSDLRALSLSGLAWPTVERLIRSNNTVISLELHAIRGLDSIEQLGVLPGLEALRVSSCTSLRSIGDLRRFPELRQLEIDDCPALDLPDLLRTSSLRGLYIVDAQSPIDLEMFGALPRLQELAVIGGALRSLRGIESIPSLRSIDLHFNHPYGLELLAKTSVVDVRMDYMEPSERRALSEAGFVSGSRHDASGPWQRGRGWIPAAPPIFSPGWWQRPSTRTTIGRAGPARKAVRA